MQTDKTNEWIWRHFAVRLPGDWELLQYSRNAAAGRCAYADRYAFRFELSWRVVPGPPDVERMLSDYEMEHVRQGGAPPQRATHADWRGFETAAGPAQSSRYGRYFPGEGCLVEAVFLWPHGIDRDLIRATLASIREEPSDPGGFRRWRAFGMDLLVPPGLNMQSCTIRPAQAEWMFADQRRRRQMRVQRLGMVADWLEGTPSDWLKRTAAKDAPGGRPTIVNRHGHDIACLVGPPRRTWNGRLGRSRTVAARYGWICPENGRLFGLSVNGLDERPRSRAEWFDCLGCCAARRVTP